MGDAPPANWMGLAGNLGAVAFVLWLAYYLTTSALPKMAGEFRESLDRQRGDFRESLADQRKDFLIALERERSMHHEALKSQAAAIDRVHHAIRDHDKWERALKAHEDEERDAT